MLVVVVPVLVVILLVPVGEIRSCFETLCFVVDFVYSLGVHISALELLETFYSMGHRISVNQEILTMNYKCIN